MKQSLKNRDRKLLITLAEYRILSTTQIALLEDMNVRSVRRVMKRYLELEYVDSISRSFSGTKGRPESLFCLSEKGVNALHEHQLVEPSVSFEKIKWEGQRSLEHQVGVNWVLIHAMILERFRELEVRHISHTSPFHPASENGVPFIHESVPQNDDLSNSIGFTPDAVMAIKQIATEKALLFFLEYDRATVTLVSEQYNSIMRKIINYQHYFRRKDYKKYEKFYSHTFNGFRLLFVCDSEKRLNNVCQLVQEYQPSNFIWLSTLDAIKSDGLGADIWVCGGKTDKPPASILGPKMSFKLTENT